MTTLKEKIEKLAKKYSNNLDDKVKQRVHKMQDDDKSHYLIYRVLRISNVRKRTNEKV
ncbi:ApaLI family restriction endonuclease [uncultured Granulicatella sp.]|uniref:ApaLI family restriction endonuclease n=1 Tax=uncultured Granulicatella sp. TaxID=316089 RepID=UPI0028D6CFA0|nr:ApaLI family restriction endonuclease [uncultured Granulicatella sp.]